jgi:hypothetical protein
MTSVTVDAASANDIIKLYHHISIIASWFPDIKYVIFSLDPSVTLQHEESENNTAIQIKQITTHRDVPS